MPSVTERPLQPSSAAPAQLELNTEGTCANATTQFCCVFTDTDQSGFPFTNSVPCGLGDLCCSGGVDGNGYRHPGGCCFGQPASQYSCAMNGAICP
jgi:hypothetical protein